MTSWPPLGAATAACTAPGRPRPTRPASRSRPSIANPVFRSSEGAAAPADACAKYRQFPAGFALAAADDGGVRLVTVRVFPGHLVRDSISVGPGAPESGWDIAALGPATELLTIRLAPPSAGSVRTGVLAIFEVAPANPDGVAILASARDYRGNQGDLYQVDARLDADPVICRGQRGQG
ncbi:MAG: hypothetical protein U1E53_16260 [Dongiaceae bacterium]